ncbi:MAG: hypothetical protein U5R46_01240 [Gammaproteobacteria bacterium]|nr:hypothetical protein [Gammaproteobacteria bacterium]
MRRRVARRYSAGAGYHIPVPWQLAEAADSTPSIFLYDTVIALHSEDEPQVVDLTRGYDGGSFGDRLSPAEISDALDERGRFY